MSGVRDELCGEPALRGEAGLPPRLPGADGAALDAAARELGREPALGGTGAPRAGGAGHSGEDPNGIWGEPALAAAPAAAAARARHAAWLAAQWDGARPTRRAGVFLALALEAGPFALLCAIVGESVSATALAIAVAGPVAEELAKIAAPLMMLEKRPWLFSSGASLAGLCALSGLVFATIENLVYFFVYIQDPTPEIVLWRLFACTALHIVCASLSGFGLARAWRRAAAARGAAEPSLATPWIVAAMAVHGAYNALATAWELLAPGA